jgi:hypothetical protein
VDWKPSLGSLLISILVISRFVKDGDTHIATLVDVGMPNLGKELHLGGTMRIILGEVQVTLEEASLTIRKKAGN